MNNPTPVPNYPAQEPDLVQIGFEPIQELLYVHKEHNISANVVILAFNLRVVRFAAVNEDELFTSSPCVFTVQEPLQELVVPLIGNLKFPQDFELVGEV